MIPKYAVNNLHPPHPHGHITDNFKSQILLPILKFDLWAGRISINIGMQ